MNPQVELLLEIQDLQTQREGLADEFLREMESRLFDMQVEDALRVLEEKVDELVQRLEPPVRNRYRQLARRGMRPVVPVLQGICYGCFTAVPTAWAAETDRNAGIAVCQNCGRFLYHVR